MTVAKKKLPHVRTEGRNLERNHTQKATPECGIINCCSVQSKNTKPVEKIFNMNIL